MMDLDEFVVDDSLKNKLCIATKLLMCGGVPRKLTEYTK
jgi:hypothetical protein